MSDRVSPDLLQLTAASLRRRQPQMQRRTRIGMSALMWLCLSVGCGDDETPSRPAKDAGSDPKDATTDARTRDGDDAGDDRAENDSCGFADREYARLLRGETTIFPGGGTEERTLNARVTSVEVSTALRDTSRIRLREGADDYTIETSEIASLGVVVGDEVELSYKHESFSLYPASSRVSLRVRGQLVFSYTKRYPLPDGFTKSWGAEQCKGRWHCERWTAYALRLTAPCGDTVELRSNQRGSVCDWDVVPGSLLDKRPERVDDTCGHEGIPGIEVLMARPAPVDQDAGM